MEEKHRELLQSHRTKFMQSVDVERLYPILKSSDTDSTPGALDENDIEDIEQLHSQEDKVDKLLEILPTKGPQAFQALCLALETTYPHLLTVMFLGDKQGEAGSTSESRSPSIASTSSEDILRPTHEIEDDSSSQSTSDRSSSRISNSHDYDLHQNNLSLLKRELKLTEKDRDNVYQELKMMEKNRDHLKDELQKLENNIKSMNDEPKDYDWLKSQCERAMNELQALKKQHSTAVEKCDQALKEAEHFRQKNRHIAGKLDEAKSEIIILKSQCTENIADKKRLEQEIRDMQEIHDENKKEIDDLRKQHREVIYERGSSEVLNKMYDTALDKYETTRKDYEALRKRYADLMTTHSTAVSKLELVQEDHTKLKKRYDEVCLERDHEIMERKGLQQQCTTAIRQWDIMQREINDLKADLSKTQHLRSEAMKEVNQAMVVRLKLTKDLARVTEERNAAVQEYMLIMSERDTVHKEMEQLNDKLVETQKKYDENEKETKNLRSEVESLRQETESALSERDRFLKECNDLRAKYGHIISVKMEVQKERDEALNNNRMIQQERDVARKERHEALEQRDRILRETYEKTQKELAEEKDLGNKEIEALRKEIEKLKQELTESREESDVAKKRREWAFTERDKIVLERESIRTLCDQLRRERDRLVSDLGEALRDSDELKKHKNEATKELTILREKYEAFVEKEARKTQLNSIGHNHSRDSAIDTDLQEWETETLEFNIRGVNDLDIGFDLITGREDPHLPNDNSIFVSSITKGSGADGKLKLNDQLLKVDNIDVTNLEKKAVFQAIRNSHSGGVVNMVVRRRKWPSKLVQPVHLNMAGEKEVGIQLEGGMYVTKIVPGSAAARESNLAVGDRLLSVNGHSVENKSIKEVLDMLDSNSEFLTLNVQKFYPSPSPTLSSPSNNTLLTTLQQQSQTIDNTAGSRSPIKPWPVHAMEGKQNVPHGRSQNDSLESSHFNRKPGRNHENKENIPDSKSRSSNHEPSSKFLDKYFHFDKIFRSRHKTKEGLSKSGTAITDTSLTTAEEDVLGQLDQVITNHDSSNKGTLTKKDKKKYKEGNGGTWPRCTPEGLSLAAGTISIVPSHKKERPPIPDTLGFRDGHYQAYKTPPAPPARTDASFAASIRHSPQNSDVSAKLPFGSPSSSSGTSGGTSTGGNKPPLPYGHSPTKPPKSLPLTLTPNSDTNKRADWHYSTTSTPDSSMDYSKVAQYKQIKDPKHRPGRRPNSAQNRKHQKHQRPTYQSQPAKTVPAFDMNQSYPNSKYQYDQMNNFNSPRSYDRLSTSSSSTTGNNTMPRANHFSPVSGSHGLHSNPGGFPRGSNSSGSNTLPHSTPTSPRITTPPGMYSRGVNSSIPEMDMDRTRYYPAHPRYIPSPSPSGQSSLQSSSTLDRSITPTLSEDHFPHTKGMYAPRHYTSRYQDHWDGSSTFPRMPSTGRIKIASPNSVKLSSNSFERVSERGSPLSPYSDYPGTRSSTGSIPAVETPRKMNKPDIGDTRDVHIEKSSEPLGIQIQHSKNGEGIFVSSVSQNSLAANAGLEVGDQLLEVCGINMRTAPYDLAANILRQCGDSVTMKVQYNPEKLTEDTVDSSDSSTPPSHSTSPTTSPKITAKYHGSNRTITSSTPTNSPRNNPNNASNSSQENYMLCEPRFVFLRKSVTSSLGINLIGGNAVGIFVHEVQKDSVACRPDGLRCGDQILEFNGVDLRSATAEQAANELSKPTETVTILAQYNTQKYMSIQEKPGDSFYIKALFERHAENDGELSFKRDDVLYIENTVCNGVIGTWKSWLVDDEGNKLQCGTIPSKVRVEEELACKKHLSESLQEDELKNASSRRGSASARRSFFRRKAKHQRNNSKDSRELASFSDISINSDSVPILDDGTVLTYQRVERLDLKVLRPVMILGPLAEALINKLTSESPDKYCRCEPVPMKILAQSMDKGLSDGVFVDYRIKEDHYECITLEDLKRLICEKNNRHALLDVNPSAIERLHRHQIYPIVLFIKHKSNKSIREVKDTRFLPEKASNRAAKEMFEHFQKVELDFKHLFSNTIQGGNLALMSQQIKMSIESEQKKTIWVPSGSL